MTKIRNFMMRQRLNDSDLRYRPLQRWSSLFAVLSVCGVVGCVDSIPPDISYDYGLVREELCGDRVLTRSEECDDGNLIDGDGCSSRCEVESLPLGGEPAGEIPAGEIPAGETSAGEDPAGEMPAGEDPAGESSAGEMPAGEDPAGETPAGEMPAGEMPAGETPAGEAPAGEMPAGEMTGGSNGDLCGDGTLGQGEECDDGNQADGDGCSAACQLEAQGCQDDLFEPNNEIASAQPLVVGEQPSTLEAMLCEGDLDVYEINGCAGGQLEIVVDFDFSATDLDLRLTDASGRLLNSSAVALAVERLSQSLSADEPVYLEVYGYLNGEEGAYTINTTLANCGVQVACNADIDCGPTQRCDAGQCVDAPTDDCQFDFDCNPGEECVSGQCIETQPPECQRDAECPANERCVAGTCTPTVNVECTLDSDCPVGRVCRDDACVPVGPQLDDLYEENDTLESAVALAPGVYQDLQILSRDDDYFSVEVCSGGTLDASISFSDFSGDLELELLDASEDTLDISVSSNDDEDVSWTNRGVVSEVVYVRVYGYSGDGNVYDLNIQVSGCGGPPVNTLGDDIYEDNDTFQEATSITPGAYDSLTLTEDDDDWYVFDVCEGGNVQVDILFSNAQGNLDAWLYDGAVNYLDASFTSNDNESLTANDLRAQQVYVRVYSFGDEADYQINITVTGCNAGLEPDRLEDNDTRETGEVLTPNLYGDLTLTEGDEDWILFDVCEGGTVTVDLTFSDADGDIDMRLYDEAGVSRASAMSVDDNESITYTNAASGQYALRIYGYGNNNNLYDLEFSVTDCAPPGLAPDRLEENDTRETGEVLTPNLYSNLTITAGDRDWILFDVCEGGDIEVELTFTDADGDIDARIYNPSGVSVASGLSSDDNEVLTYQGASAGRYAIEVYSYGDTENTYDLRFSVQNCNGGGDGGNGTLQPDRLEENDTRETGSALTPNLYGNLTITPGDRDWILFDVCEGGDIEVELTFTDADGDIDARIYNPSEISVASGLSSDDNELLTYQDAPAGRYAIEIFSYGDSENTYDLRFSVLNCNGGGDGGSGGLQPDRLENNDTQETAEVLLPNLYSNLTITENDEDWVAFDVCEGGDIEVEINFTGADGDLELELYDADSIELDSSTSPFDVETVNYLDAAAGRYYARVYGFLGDVNSYDLTIRVTCP